MNVPTRMSTMMPPPCGSSRSSTPWANATPIQATPKTVSAMPSVPAWRWGSVIANSTGKTARSVSRTWKSSPKVGGERRARRRRGSRPGGRARCRRRGRTARRGRGCPAARMREREPDSPERDDRRGEERPRGSPRACRPVSSEPRCVGRAVGARARTRPRGRGGPAAGAGWAGRAAISGRRSAAGAR